MSGLIGSSKRAKKSQAIERQAIEASLERTPSGLCIFYGDSNSSQTPTSQVPNNENRATGGTRKRGRGESTLAGIIGSKDKKPRVEFDEFGETIGDVGTKYSSTLPILARGMVPITIEKWNQLPETLLKELWDAVQLLFDVDNSASYDAFKKMGNVWCSKKSELTKKVLEVRNNPRKIQLLKPGNVPTMEEWLRFV